MNPLIQFKNATALCLVAFALAWFGLSPTVQAQLPLPTPDGFYPNNNTAEGDAALFSVTTGGDDTAIGSSALTADTTGGENTAVGTDALSFNQGGNSNTAIGVQALQDNVSGNNNTATGLSALFHNTTVMGVSGNNNTANGVNALGFNTTGKFNTADGVNALLNNTTGSTNVALGVNAGKNLSTGSNNVCIGVNVLGGAGESNTTRIGSGQTRTFIAGIHGVAVAGSTVTVSASGQLGVLPSSARFKDEIKRMDRASEAILALKPVSFRYKKELDPAGVPQFGLVAEEVEKVNPALVARDADGKPYTVRYEAVNAMLLNEFLKEHQKVQQQDTTIADLKSTVAEQQKQIKALTAGLQKVSAEVEMSKPAPQIVVNDQ